MNMVIVYNEHGKYDHSCHGTIQDGTLNGGSGDNKDVLEPKGYGEGKDEN